MFRFDLHVHSHYSGDACDSPEALVEAAKVRGLHGIAITDHDSVEAYGHCLDVGLAREEGVAVEGFLVVPGVEISTADGHLLCLGVRWEGLTGLSARDVVEAVNESGGVAVPAHPFDRWRKGILPPVLDDLEVGVIEVFNSAAAYNKINERAAEYARMRGLAGVAGSDAHCATAVGTSTTSYDLPQLDVPSLLEAVVKGGELHCEYLSPVEGIKKHLANFFRKPPAPRRFLVGTD